MGLDVHVYRLERPCSPAEQEDEAVSSKTFWVSERQLKAWLQHWPDMQATRPEFFKAEELAKDFSIPEGFELDTWDLSVPQGWAVYVDSDGKLPSRRIEVESDRYLGVKDEYEVELVAAMLGYLRKPFRGAHTSAVQDGDTLTLSLTNFNSTVESNLLQLLGEAAVGKCYALLGYEDMDVLQALKDLCDEPEMWQQQVLDKMTDGFCVTIIDW